MLYISMVYAHNLSYVKCNFNILLIAGLTPVHKRNNIKYIVQMNNKAYTAFHDSVENAEH